MAFWAGEDIQLFLLPCHVLYVKQVWNYLIPTGSTSVILMLKDPDMLWLLALSASLTLAGYTNKAIGFQTAILNTLEPEIGKQIKYYESQPYCNSD